MTGGENDEDGGWRKSDNEQFCTAVIGVNKHQKDVNISRGNRK